MSTDKKEKNNLSFLNSAGETGKLIAEKDWLSSELGQPEVWPHSLCTALSIVLNTPIPMVLFWGPQQICFYNSSYLALQTQNDFSNLLGKPASLVFPETWINIYPIIKIVLEGENIQINENYIIPQINTNSWNFNYSPVYDETGNPAAVLISCNKNINFSDIEYLADNHIELQNIRETFERKAAEADAIIENTMFPISVISADTMEILTANESIIKIWGKGKDVIGKQFSEIMPELEAQKVFETVKKVIRTGVPFSAINQQFEIIKNGETVTQYFNYSFVPLKNNTGKIYAILNTSVDITEITEARIKVENTVNELKLFKFMADNAADKLILIRKDASFAYVNNRVLSKWGYTKNEIEQLSVYDVDTLYDKKDFESLFENSFKNPSLQFETNHKNKRGEIFPVEVSVTGLLLDEEPFIFVIARDISERKKAELELRKAFTKVENSEKRFRDSVKQAPLGIAIFKGENFIAEMVNNDYYKIIDQQEEEFLNRPLFESLPEVKEAIEPIFKDIYRTGKPYHSNEFPAYLRRNNSLELNYFNLMYHPLKDENEICTGIMVVATDITENVIAKKKLLESEKQFRNMIMESPVAITILRGEDFIFEMANKTMLEKIIGYKENEIIGKPLYTVFPEIKNQKYPAILLDVFKNGGSQSFEEATLMLKRPDGNVKLLIDVTFTGMSATDTTPAGVMITSTIVNEKVDARKSMEESSERLRLATEAAEMGTWELDLQNKTLIHSPQLAIIFGEDPEKKFGFEKLRSKFYLKDLELIVQPALEKAKETGIYFYEARILKNDGKVYWIKTHGKVIFDQQKNPIKMMGTTLDITTEKLFTEKLEKSEERFRLLANEVPQLIWAGDPQGNIYYYNESVFNYSGLNKETLYNNGWLQMIHPDDREENLRLWQLSISSGNDFLIEHRFRRFDGVYRWQLSRAVAQRNEQGEIQAWVGSSTDIQDIKEQEQQKDFFISMASHELKTPVTSIKGYVQILQSLYVKTEDKFLNESLKVVDRQIVTLTKLISELLDISKIKSGGLEIKKEEFEVPELIKEVAQQINHTTPNYIIDLDLVPSAKIRADKDRISQVLINLLTNAIKYAPNATIIKVKCLLENDSVSISVKDEGIGISKSNQEKIFHRFYRVEGKNEQTYPGFGIGLFIASEIIKKHQGAISVESELGKGSTFSFSLPLLK